MSRTHPKTAIPSNFYLTPRTHPLRFLLYLEWSLLFIVALSEVFRTWALQIPRLPALNLLCLLVFALLGLALPQRQLAVKFAYTAIEFASILLASLVGGIRLFPILYIVLVTRNCLIFQGRSRLIVTSIAYGLFAITQTARLRDSFLARRVLMPEQVAFLNLTFALLFGLVLLFAQLSINAILAERHSREQLAIAHDRLRTYALKAEDIATLKERNRVAREIHDALGHSLTTFNLHLEAALRLLASDPQPAKDLLIEAKQLAAAILSDVRQSVAALRTDPIADKSLEAAIASLIDEFRRATGIEPQTQIHLTCNLSQKVKIAAYRIVQEALTNIAKYADATCTSITIETRDRLELKIQDNGRGFILDRNTTGFGLQGMRERAFALGGELIIQTAPDRGCTIFAALPLDPVANGDPHSAS